MRAGKGMGQRMMKRLLELIADVCVDYEAALKTCHRLFKHAKTTGLFVLIEFRPSE